jgi:GLPGLI family protein
MRTLIMICSSLVLAMSAKAQSGTVVYNETRKLEIHLEGGDASEMANLLPKERKSIHTLYYTPDASLYTNSKQTDDQDVAEDNEGGKKVVIKMNEPQDQVFMDFKNKKKVEQRDFLSRMFLIESAPDSLPWKLTGEHKEILGFQCMEASYIKDSTKTKAWFAPTLPISGGPANYTGLPGLILEVSTNNGKRVLSAVSVTPGDVSSMIIKPKQGKKVTKEEFRKIVEEKAGPDKGEGGGTIMIRVEQH